MKESGLDSSGRLALITGGQGDLGRAMAEALSDGVRTSDFKVLGPGREELDVTSEESVNQYFSDLGAQGELDLLVCNAGVIDDRLISKMSEESWDEVLRVNLRGAFLAARAAAKLMMKQKFGHIVFVSSFAAFHPSYGQASYASAKAALIGFAKSLAQELGSRNIRVNVIVPGFMETKMTAELSETVLDSVRKVHTLNELNTPLRVGKFLHCLHAEMESTSGQVFNLDSRVL